LKEIHWNCHTEPSDTDYIKFGFISQNIQIAEKKILGKCDQVLSNHFKYAFIQKILHAYSVPGIVLTKQIKPWNLQPTWVIGINQIIREITLCYIVAEASSTEKMYKDFMKL
jgi:hypothetical protein